MNGGFKKDGGGFGGGGFGGKGGGRGGGRDERGQREDRGGNDMDRGGGRGFGRRKGCRYCADKNLKVDYKNAADPKNFITERGKTVPRPTSGNCPRHPPHVPTAS